MSAVLPGPGVEVEVCLAIGRQAEAAVWDEGRWDVNVWSQPDTELGDWVDVTCDVEVPFSLAAGTDRADGVVTRWEAATMAFKLHGDQYNPRSGPHAGLLGPGLPVRLRWRPEGDPTWRPGFAGYVDDSGFTWAKRPGRVGSAQLACSDGTRILNAADLMKRAPVGGGELASERVARILDAVVWPTELRDVEAGGVPVRSTELDGDAWSQLLLVADTDLAHMWIDAAGVLCYRPQGRVRPLPDPVAVITCDPADEGITATIPPVSITGQQPTAVRNVANIQRSVDEGAPDAPVVTVADDRSIERYLRRPYSRTDLVHTDDEYSQLIAQAVLNGAAWPSLAPEAVQLTSRADVQAGYLLLLLGPDLTVQVRDTDSTLWTCQPAGWEVEVGRREISGRIALVDVSGYVGARWDSAIWDQSRWSY